MHTVRKEMCTSVILVRYVYGLFVCVFILVGRLKIHKPYQKHTIQTQTVFELSNNYFIRRRVVFHYF